MRRLNRILIVSLAAVLLSLSVSAPSEAARPACSADDPIFQFCWFPGPSGWTRINWQFDDCATCRTAGDEGVRDGDWPEYHCGYFPVGLDVVYYIYVPPDTETFGTGR